MASDLTLWWLLLIDRGEIEGLTGPCGQSHHGRDERADGLFDQDADDAVGSLPDIEHRGQRGRVDGARRPLVSHGALRRSLREKLG